MKRRDPTATPRPIFSIKKNFDPKSLLPIARSLPRNFEPGLRRNLKKNKNKIPTLYKGDSESARIFEIEGTPSARIWYLGGHSKLQQIPVKDATPNQSLPSKFFRMTTKTVKVSNVSLRATKRDIQDFFSFSGEIDQIELQSDTEHSQVAFVTFKDPQALDTALLLSGATIVDQSVNITPVENYLPHAEVQENNPPPYTPKEGTSVSGGGGAVNKAQDVVTSMLAKGFVLGKDAMGKAKAFDEKHGLTANASAKVTSLDKKIGFTEKISAGTAVVNEKVRSVDQKFQVSEKTKSAFAAAEEKVNSAGSALMKNRYILTGTSWVTGAFSRVAKAAEDVGMKTKEKVQLVEGQKDNQSHTSSGDLSHEFAPVHLTESNSAHYTSLPR